jgi:mono/diheme cytochrome c family protein
MYSEDNTRNKKWDANTHDRTNFPLIGKHRTVPCGDCHLEGVLQGTPTSCEACHWIRKKDDRYNLQLGLHCGDCHTPLDWKAIRPGAWNHAQKTGYPLTGSHRILDCFQCHKNNNFSGLSNDCYNCHKEEYNSVTEPNHLAAQFPTDCSLCHTGTTWNVTNYSHTSFPLNGSHLTADCSSCHKNGVYSGTPTQCVACHLDEYNQAREPNHLQAGFSTECQICHGIDAISWQGAILDHNLVWPLRGAHLSLACNECHANGYDLPQNCYGCHQADYQATTDPNHLEAGFSTNCEICHGIDAITWEGAVFNHNQIWPLQGAHQHLDCAECHSHGYDLPRNCYGCHQADYQATTNPNHITAGFPTNCEYCHFPTHLSWSQAVFNHNFPIYSGKHAGLACTDCHLTANYNVFSCIDCHAHSKNKMDGIHKKVTGYVYQSQACYSCHPQGVE